MPIEREYSQSGVLLFVCTDCRLSWPVEDSPDRDPVCPYCSPDGPSKITNVFCSNCGKRIRVGWSKSLNFCGKKCRDAHYQSIKTPIERDRTLWDHVKGGEDEW